MDILHMKNKFRAPMGRDIEDVNLHLAGKCRKIHRSTLFFTSPFVGHK